jgi:uncharacterized membrane protein YdjX (TVP38/TMEM64 family)
LAEGHLEGPIVVLYTMYVPNVNIFLQLTSTVCCLLSAVCYSTVPGYVYSWLGVLVPTIPVLYYCTLYKRDVVHSVTHNPTTTARWGL